MFRYNLVGVVVAALGIALLLFSTGGEAQELANRSPSTPGSEGEARATFTEMNDKAPAAIARTVRTTQFETTTSLSPGSPMDGNCQPSDGSFQLQEESRTGRICTTQYRLEVPTSANGVLFTLDKLNGSVDVILIFSFGNPLDEADQFFISRPEGDEITDTEAIVCIEPRCPVGPSGTWYIGVVNFTDESQEYQLAASVTPQPLTSGETRTGTIEGVPPDFQASLGFVDYTIAVPQGATRLRVELEGRSGGNIDLAMRSGDPVTVQDGQLVADYLADSVEGVEILTIDSTSTPALQAGTYYMTVINTEPARQNFFITATVERESRPFPLEATPSSVRFEATVGGPTPSAQDLVLENPQTPSVEWSASVNVPWARLSPSAGTLDANQTTTLSVSIDLSGLEAGTYEGEITFTSPGFAPLIVPVVLALEPEVEAEGDLVALQFTALQFESPSDWQRRVQDACVIYTNVGAGSSRVRVTLPDGAVRTFDVPEGRDVVVCGNVVHIDTRASGSA